MSSVQSSDKLVITREDLEKAEHHSKIKAWSREEDRLLLRYREKEGLDWEEVAKFIPGRNARMCYNRYKRICLSDSVSWKRKDEKNLL